MSEEPSLEESFDEEAGEDLEGDTHRIYMFWILALLIVLADQISKMAALQYLGDNSSIPVIPHLFELRLEFNRGAAFSLFVGGRWIFVGVSLAAMIFLPLYLRNLLQSGERNWLYPTGLGLILGGAIGNAIDRVFREQGMVVDFFHAYWKKHSFPVFNIADSAITVGLGMLLLVMFWPETVTRRDNES